MNADRRIRLWGRVVADATGKTVTIENVCTAAVWACGVDSAAMAMGVSASAWETVYASDPLASKLEELALTLGEGPGPEAMSDGPVLAADLAEAGCANRWPVFAPAAVEAGIRAVFALPLQAGGIRLGVMSLYRGAAGDLSRGQFADALVLADTACALLLDGAEPYRSRPSLAAPEPVGMNQPEVHQATGMVIVQLGVTAAAALARLRAYAFVHDRPLRDIAGDVVARRLRFEGGL